MRLKRNLIFCCLILLVIASLGIISADACWIETSSATCTSNNGYSVMKLSGSTNAHGGTLSSTYSNVLCCDVGLGESSGGLVTKLSATINAHAISPLLSDSGYDTLISYDGFEYCRVINYDLNCNTAGDEISVMGLSGNTNAHLSSSSSATYPTKLCCKVNPICIIEDSDVYWASSSGSEIDEAVLDSTVQLVVEADCEDDVEVSFEISDGIGSVGSGFFSDGKAYVSWTATPKGTYSFEATVTSSEDTAESGNLDVVEVPDTYCDDNSIQFCEDYTNSGMCNNGDNEDYCDVAEAGTYCIWDEETCKVFVGGTAECGNGLQETGEGCDDGNTIDEDGCSSECENEGNIDPPCPNGLTLCSDNTCSLNCGETDEGTICDGDGICDANEGCSCADCDGEEDTCTSGLLCNLISTACCNSATDGTCNIACIFIDPDCSGGCTVGASCTTEDSCSGTYNSDCACIDTAGDGCPSSTCTTTGESCTTDDCSGTYNSDCACVDVEGDGCPYTDPECGNGIPEFGEQCDLGILNGVGDSGCTINCEYEEVDAPCPEGLTLCDDDTCSLNCGYTDLIEAACDYDNTCDSGEGCSCADCDGEEDSCASGLVCSLEDNACCNPNSDGECNSYCAFIDPDCEVRTEGGGSGCIKTTHSLEEEGYECDDNTFEYTWTGEWVDADGNKITDCDSVDEDSKSACEICLAGGTESRPCPPQVQLPFFNLYGLICTVVIISVVYAVLILKKKK